MLQIFRTNTSSYQPKTYFYEEKSKIESLQGIKYISQASEIDDNMPIVLITNTHTTPQTIPRVILDKTVLILHPNSGYDNFPLNFVRKTSIPIVLGNSIRSHAVAEYVLSCLFKHFTDVPLHSDWSKTRSWNRKLISQQKILIMGYGHLGKILYHSLQPLAGEITIVDPHIKAPSELKNFHPTWTPDLAQDKDVVILAASLNEKSKNIIHHDFLQKLNNDVTIINAARGELIHEKDFLKFMQLNPKATAYLDVFNQEPFICGYLKEFPNIKKTSHIAGSHLYLNKNMIEFEYEVIKDFSIFYAQNKLDDFMTKYYSSILNNKNDDLFLK